MPPTKAHQAEVAERRAALIKLRRQKIPFDDPRVLGLGYTSRQAASKDMIRALEQRRDEEAAEVSVYRQELLEDLDELIAAIWPQAIDGDVRAVEATLKLLQNKSKLRGCDMPVRAEVSGPDGGAIPLGSGALAELNALIGIAGETGIVLPGDEDIEDESTAAG